MFSFRTFHSLLGMILVGLIFQIVKISSSRFKLPFSFMVGLIPAILGMFVLVMFSESLPQFLIGTALLGHSVSTLRIWSKFYLGKVDIPKNIVRAFGFILSPFFSPWLVGGMIIVCLVILSRLPREVLPTSFHLSLKPIGRIEKNHVAMFIHHFHYFAYAYSLPFLFLNLPRVDYPLQGLIFYMGWIGYDLYDVIKVPTSWRLFAIGHIVAAASIIGVFYSAPSMLMIILWTITGMGGGTVMLLTALRSPKDPAPSENLDLAEDYGHVAGMLILILIVLYGSILTIGLIAAGIALTTALVPLIGIGRQRRQCELL